MEKKWQVLDPAPQSFYDEHPELPVVVARLLYHRNIRSQEEMDEFLNPEYTTSIHDPFLFQDMEKATDRIFLAIKNDEHIVIHGDYDADGVCSSSILTITLRALGAKHIDVFLPHRETDGYGLNTNTIEKLHEKGTHLIITCDCGISNTKEVALANELGMDVIVTDHHSVPEDPPAAFATIHPGVPGEPYPDAGLSGGGVAFKLAQGLLHAHKKTEKPLLNGDTHEVCEKWLLDLVAISSVADMVPLIGESRTLTKYGLIVLNKTKRLGLQKLLFESKLTHEDGTTKKEITADSIGFKIAPRINAAGRLNHANVAYNLLVSSDPIEATDLAFQLDTNNRDRQKLTEQYVKEAVEQIEAGQEKNPVLFVKSHHWSPGIVGLIASRLKSQYQKPSIALTHHNGNIMGSGRSIPGFNMIKAIQALPSLFEKSGGHPMACGFTLKDPELFETFKTQILEKYTEQTKDIDMTPVVTIDTEITLEDIGWDLYDVLDKFHPFGKGNEKPLYLAKGVTVNKIKAVGKKQNHINLFLTHNTPRIRKFIGWNLCSENGTKNWCTFLSPGDTIDIVFELGINEWNGNRELQMTIFDLRKSI